MKQESWKWLFTWEGRVQRGPYFLAGAILTVLKYAIDSAVAAHFGETWRIWNYILPASQVSIFQWGHASRRCTRPCGRSQSLSFGLGLRSPCDDCATRRPSWLDISLLCPHSQPAAFPLADAGSKHNLADLRRIPCGEMRQSRSVGQNLGSRGCRGARRRAGGLGRSGSMVYGWGLFLGVPFLTGFVASWFLNMKTTRSSLNDRGERTDATSHRACSARPRP